MRQIGIISKLRHKLWRKFNSKNCNHSQKMKMSGFLVGDTTTESTGVHGQNQILPQPVGKSFSKELPRG